jgi:hypothetical protein
VKFTRPGRRLSGATAMRIVAAILLVGSAATLRLGDKGHVSELRLS